jgi:hypothetical protein
MQFPQLMNLTVSLATIILYEQVVPRFVESLLMTQDGLTRLTENPGLLPVLMHREGMNTTRQRNALS